MTSSDDMITIKRFKVRAEKAEADLAKLTELYERLMLDYLKLYDDIMNLKIVRDRVSLKGDE